MVSERVTINVTLLVTFLYLGCHCNGAKHVNGKSVSDVMSQWIFKDKCMDELGCFNNGPPFFKLSERPLSLLPSDRKDIATKFLLYTQRNPFQSYNLIGSDLTLTALRQSTFDPRLDTKFIVPGFISWIAPDWKDLMKDALLHNQDCNVFLVDWSGGDGPLYEQAVANSRVVGAEIAHLVQFLQESFGIKPDSIHLIGHSLGAHVSGYAGKRIKNLGRITGLDPAGPYFENVDPKVRLDRLDALLVDVIHTNGGENRFTGFGTTESIGHLDFYPNGGRLQPGCPDIGHAVLGLITHPSLDVNSLHDVMCNHHRALDLFISSINNDECENVGLACDTWNNFLAGKCGNCSSANSMCLRLGLRADSFKPMHHKASINLYLETTATIPFCIK